jgi:hypothetical protein
MRKSPSGIDERSGTLPEELILLQGEALIGASGADFRIGGDHAC